jgi:NADH-quinone oxidoreductase subunit F
MEDKNQNQGIISRFWKENGQLSLLEYEEAGGLKALKNVFSGKVSPEDVIAEIEQSGLCGRGGGGFSTGQKWRLGRAATLRAEPHKSPAESQAYFICNADESEPGTYKDRLIIEKSPYLLLEGLIIGAWALGANRAYIYINNSYKTTTHTLRKAIKLMEDAHWLGENIQNSGFSLRLEIFEGAGSYVCREETALINSIEGKRGEPRLKPPFPADKGLFGRPTVINNVETLANVPYILEAGASAYLTRGKSEETPGTKLFIINGAVRNPGVYEAPMGASVNELIDNYAIGMEKGKELRCVQVGGSAGGLYSGDELDQPLGYGGEDCIPMGSGTLLVIDKSVDLRRLLMSWARFFRRESCGKCAPCREGTYQLYLLAERIARGKIMAGDRERIEDLIFTLQRASFCPFGCFAVNAWESLLKKFPDEIFSA